MLVQIFLFSFHGCSRLSTNSHFCFESFYVSVSVIPNTNFVSALVHQFSWVRYPEKESLLLYHNLMQFYTVMSVSNVLLWILSLRPLRGWDVKWRMFAVPHRSFGTTYQYCLWKASSVRKMLLGMLDVGNELLILNWFRMLLYSGVTRILKSTKPSVM